MIVGVYWKRARLNALQVLTVSERGYEHIFVSTLLVSATRSSLVLPTTSSINLCSNGANDHWLTLVRDQVTVAMFRSTVILCTIVVQLLAAPNPNGCIESCSTYHSQQMHEALVQQQTAALNQVAASQLKDLDFSRPGNWTEQNEYRTDSGRGRVYEEQGQVVTGPRRVQYYKKNYSSSHGVNTDADVLRSLGGMQSTLDSQRLIGATSGLDSVAHHSTYDKQRHQEVHQATNRVIGHSGRLEDFGERVDDTHQILQQVPSVASGGNWHRADSWRTDGGRGIVHEEEGQLVNGPTKVKYYRQNYSSSYSSGDIGAVVPSIAQPNLEAELQQLHSKLDNYGREIHHQSTVDRSNLGSVSQTVGNTGYVDDNILATTNTQPQPVSTYENIHERQQSTIRHGVVAAPISNNYHQTRDDRYQERESLGRDYSATNSHVDDRREGQTSQRLYVVPSRPLATVQKTETHQVYQETVAPQSQIVLTSDNGQSVDRTNSQLVRVPIHTNSNYRSYHSNGEVQDNRPMNTHSQMQTAEEIRQAQIRQSQILNQNLQHQNSYSNGNVETVNLVRQQPAAVNHYEEKWSEGYRSHSTVPRPIASSQIISGQHANYVKTGQTAGQLGSYTAANSHNSHSRHHESGSQVYEGFRTQPDQLVMGSLGLEKIGQTGADCDQGVTTSEQYQYGSIHHRKFKRNAESGFHGRESDDLRQQSHQVEDLTQQTAGFDDFYQQHSGNLEFGQQHQQEHSGKLEFGQDTQQTEDLTQQIGGFRDYNQQASGNLEFGHQRQQQHSGKLEFGQETQQTEDLTQQTSGFGDYSQQASGNLEFGHQQPQQHSGKLEFGQETQQTEDLTQQTSGFGDYSQQASGKLEFGQETQHTEDLTQQTSGFGDYSQQASGNLEFGHQRQQQHSGKLEFGQETQQTEDLTQQTSGFGDYSQQASGNLEFGHQQPQQHSGKLEFGQETQQTEDLTQQTSGFEDYSQQASGNLEFGHQQPQQHLGKVEFGQETQHTDIELKPEPLVNIDFKRNTDAIRKSEDLTQQASGHFGFGQQQQSHSDKLEFGHETQQTEDLTQQTGGFDDFTQQTSGNLEFGQQPQHAKPKFDQETQQTEDLTQQTGGFDDFTQQTSGNLEFGQAHQHGKPKLDQETQQTEDLTQQTGGFDDFTQQTSGNLEFGQAHQHGKPKLDQETQQTEDLTQQTGGFDDFTQQTSGNLEFGQQHQHGKPNFDQETQQTEDLTQQMGGFDDFTQQTSGNLEFGQQHQHGKPKFDQETQQTEDLTQQTGGFDDFTQQNSGNFEFGRQREHGRHGFGQETQQAEGLTQQTGGLDDFTQQTSGNLKLEQQSQQANDLMQQTSDHGDDNTFGNLGFGQQHLQHSGKLKFGQETQQTDDLTQQTSGNLEFGPQHGKYEFTQQSQHSDDLTQQTGGFRDFPQQSSGNFEFGQNQQQTGTFEFGEQTTTVKPQQAYQPGVKGGRRRKPAPKPTLRSGRRYGLGSNAGDTNLPFNVDPEPDLDHSPINHKLQDVPTVLDIDEPDTQQSQNQETSHKNNPNAQWHLNHRPGDLTSNENLETHRVVNHQVVHDQNVAQTLQKTNSGGPSQQTGGYESRQNRENSPEEGQNSEPVFKLEPRIVEAYGGAGAYDIDHNDDLFKEAKHNPSATLPPNPEGIDPWDIREKPFETVNRPRFYTQPTEVTTTILPEEPTTTPAPSFWSRVSHKLTNTYEKAKEKAASIFGK